MEKIQVEINTLKKNDELEEKFIEYSTGIKTVKVEEVGLLQSPPLEKNIKSKTSEIQHEDLDQLEDEKEEIEEELDDETDWTWFDPFDENVYFILSTARP